MKQSSLGKAEPEDETPQKHNRCISSSIFLISDLFSLEIFQFLVLGMYSGQHRSVVRLLGRRYFADAAATEEYTKRNYANNVSEYNTVLGSIIAQRRSSSSPFFGGLWLLIFFFLNTRLFFNLFMYEKGWFLCNVMWSGISY